jgi:hypothetical protein
MALANSAMNNEIDTLNERTRRHNDAVAADRLRKGDVANKHAERCYQCGELLHPYPKPEYWMQYPLPTCCILDGLKFCDNNRNSSCIDEYLIEHPTFENSSVKKQSKKTLKSDKEQQELDTRNDIAAALSASMPEDQTGLLAEATAAINVLHAAVLAFDSHGALNAANRYEAAIWKLNGNTFFGCRADEKAAGNVIDRYCEAIPGEVPFWGQKGQFLIEVNGIRTWVDFGGGYGVGRTHYGFNVVDLDQFFISETGYRSHFAELAWGQTVDEAAAAIFAAYLNKCRYKIDKENLDRLASKPLPTWCSRLMPPARRELATALLPPGFVLVDVVLPAQKAYIVRKWAEDAKKKIKAVSATKPKDKTEGFRMGQRCEIVSVHHTVFSKEIGKQVVITKVSPDTRQVWAHDDVPARYRINKNGQRVIAYDPRCVQTIYSFDQLKTLNNLGE